MVTRPWRVRLELISAMIVTIFVLELILPAADYTASQWMIIITPGLQIHDSFRAGALLAGAVLMLTTVLLRFSERARLVDVAICVVIVAGIGCALWLASP